jgi:hypothetical protein
MRAAAVAIWEGHRAKIEHVVIGIGPYLIMVGGVAAIIGASTTGTDGLREHPRRCG